MKNFTNQFYIYLLTERRFSYNTAIAYKKDIEQCALFMEGQQLTLATVMTVHLKSYLAQQNLAVASRVRKICALRCFYAWLSEKYVYQDQAKDLIFPKMEQKLPIFYSLAQIKKLFKVMQGQQNFHQLRDNLLIYILYCTGIRVSELAQLKISNISISEKTIKIHGKGNKERLVPFPKILIGPLEKYIQYYHAHFVYKHRIQTDYLFVSIRNKTISVLTRQAISKILKKNWEKTGSNQEISPHKLRHTYATHMYQNGASLRHIQLLLGHESIRTTQIYTHTNLKKIKKEYKKHLRA